MKIFLEINLSLQTQNKRLKKWKLSTETENGLQSTKKRGELSYLCNCPAEEKSREGEEISEEVMDKIISIKEKHKHIYSRRVGNHTC